MSVTKNILTIQKGFSLIEISIVLVIVGLLLGGMMGPLSTQIESARRNDTKQMISKALEAIYGFTLANGRLPCPDTNNDGSENLNGNLCTDTSGDLPWATLAMKSEDAWGQVLIYQATQSFADKNPGTTCGTASTAISFALCSKGDIQVYDQVGGTPVAVAIDVPAIIVSRGKNWAVTASANEAENSDGDKNFVDKTFSSAAGAEYDDIVNWIVPGILINRMVNAGRLP